MHFQTHVFHMPEHYLSRPAALSSVYAATIRFIQAVLDHDMQTPILEFCTNYILRTLISASCILLKILNSSFASKVDSNQGRTMFNTCILAIKSASVRDSDFPERVAKSQTRMWQAVGRGFDSTTRSLRETPLSSADPLKLTMRNRMCVSHVFDCLWGWRRSLENSTNGKLFWARRRQLLIGS
jgi:transcriptional regulatory protein LEU3